MSSAYLQRGALRAEISHDFDHIPSDADILIGGRRSGAVEDKSPSYDDVVCAHIPTGAATREGVALRALVTMPID